MSSLFSFNLHVFCLIYFFYFPYFDHDAFTHHALHVLDAPGGRVCHLGGIAFMS